MNFGSLSAGTNVLLTNSAPAPYPGLPLITARDTPAPVVQALRDALTWTTRESAPIGMREDLFICGFEPLELATYAELLAGRRERQMVFGAGEVVLLLRQLLPVLAVLHR